jgi:hypothetical protein
MVVAMRALLFVLLVACGSNEQRAAPITPTADKAPRVATPAPDDAVPATPEELLENERTAERAKLDALIAAIKQVGQTVESAQNQADRDLARTRIGTSKTEIVSLRTTIDALRTTAEAMYKTSTEGQTTRAARMIREYLALDSHELDDADLALREIESKLEIAQTEADRAIAKAKLEALRKEKAELERRIRDAKKKGK